MFLWPKEIIGSLTNPFISMANSFSSSSESLRPIVKDRLNIRGSVRPPIEKEAIVYFNNDNQPITRNIFFLPYPKMANFKETKQGDQVAYMPKLN